ncbi:hypothetical protein ACRYCC_00005 [Actinomadura scrupuli]|uniref:hypothetical protein n=1 Tax=Actinomadura scrupuli TaxID=559629 RepID=UPI003D98CE85
MPSEPPCRHDLTVLADHGQFYLQDLQAHGLWMQSHGADPDLAPAGWTHEASQIYRIGVEPHSIAVGTARSDVVKTTLHLHLTAPVTDPQDAEHVVEADLDLPNGDLAIYGPADDPGQEQHLQVTPGRYRTRVSYLPSEPPAAPTTGSELGDHFLYRIDLWPTDQPTATTVVKQGETPWAG